MNKNNKESKISKKTTMSILMHVKISISEGTIYSSILQNIEDLTKLEIKEDTAKMRTMVVVITIT